MFKTTISTNDFLKQSPDYISARHHIEQVRWNGHPKCPKCSAIKRIQTR